MKHLFTGILASALLLSTATGSFAEEYTQTTENYMKSPQNIESETLSSGSCGENATWSFQNGTLTISGTGATEDFDYISGDDYFLLHRGWDHLVDEIERLVIEEGITHIGDYSFYSCSSLASISYPSTLTSIGKSAFGFCTSMPVIDIPESVTSIKDSAFFRNTSATSLHIPTSLTRIESSVFLGCSSLTSVSIPDTITFIGYSAFSYCDNLISVEVPNSVTTIDSCAFLGCRSLETFTLPSALTKMEYATFAYCDALTTLTVPVSINFWGGLYDASALTTVYYQGTEADRESIEYLEMDETMMNASWIYNSAIPEVSTPDAIPDPNTPTYAPWAETQVNFSQENHLSVDSLGLDYTKNITRLQIADLLVNMVEKSTGATLETSDQPFSDTNNESVSKAAQAGIIGGKGDGIFDPDNTATRQEISIMIVRTIEKLEELSGKSYIDHSQTNLEGFSDFEDTADWAKSFVAILANNGIMSGSDNKLTPLSPTSIEECLVLNNNLFKLTA